MLSIDGVHLEFEPEALRAIVEKAVKRSTGARGLRAVMEEIMLDVMFSIPNSPEIKSCTITSASVNENKPPRFTVEELKKLIA